MTLTADFLQYVEMEADPLSQAIEFAGGKDAFMAAVGISLRTLAYWKRHGVPDQQWPAVVAATDGRISALELATSRSRRIMAEAAS